MLIEKIVSGGQTGVDRAALNVAIFLEVEHGGWCPRGRRAEDGRIPDEYSLRESNSRDYAIRTELNVIDSDGTLVLYRDQTTGGTLLTCRMANKHRRPLLAIDLSSMVDEDVQLTETDRLLNWLKRENVQVLNIAGPRESTCSGITLAAERFLTRAFSVDSWGLA